MKQWGAVVVAALMIVSSLAACGQDTSGTPAPSGLAQAMDSVSGHGRRATQYFEYGDFARLRELGALRPHASKKRFVDRWISVIGIGAGNFAQVAYALQEPTGITPFDYDTAVTVGQPPNTATKFTGGIPKSTITSKLTKLGAKPRTFGDAEGLSLAPDNKVNLDDPVVPGLINSLNQVVVTDHELAASPNAASVRAVLGGDHSLLDTGKYQQIADCLGDVVVAMILEAPEKTNGKVVAVGVRDAGSLSSTQHEVMCVLPVAGKKAAVHEAMSTQLTPSAIEERSSEPLSRWFSAISVKNDGDVVQAVFTDQPTSPLGFVFKAVVNGTYLSWLGD